MEDSKFKIKKYEQPVAMSLCRAMALPGACCPSAGNSSWLPCCCLTFCKFYDTCYPKCNVCWIALLMPGTWQQMGLETADVNHGFWENGCGLAWSTEREQKRCWAVPAGLLLCCLQARHCRASGNGQCWWEGELGCLGGFAWRGTGTVL